MRKEGGRGRWDESDEGADVYLTLHRTGLKTGMSDYLSV